jgi:death-on-curing protein
MIFLSIAIIEILHAKLITKFGGINGIRDVGLLESALAYPQMLHQMAEEQDIHKIAAAYIFHLIKNHSFIDGNKRIAVLAMLTFLQLNNTLIEIPDQDLYELAIKAADSSINESDIAFELRKYTN